MVPPGRGGGSFSFTRNPHGGGAAPPEDPYLLDDAFFVAPSRPSTLPFPGGGARTSSYFAAEECASDASFVAPPAAAAPGPRRRDGGNFPDSPAACMHGSGLGVPDERPSPLRGLRFPAVRSVLWDATPAGPVIEIPPTRFAPRLQLQPHAVRDLARALREAPPPPLPHSGGAPSLPPALLWAVGTWLESHPPLSEAAASGGRGPAPRPLLVVECLLPPHTSPLYAAALARPGAVAVPVLPVPLPGGLPQPGEEEEDALEGGGGGGGCFADAASAAAAVGHRGTSAAAALRGAGERLTSAYLAGCSKHGGGGGGGGGGDPALTPSPFQPHDVAPVLLAASLISVTGAVAVAAAAGLPSSPLTLTPLHALRLCDTELARALQRGDLGRGGCGAPPLSGFLSMDQARKLLPLLESEPR